jgi:polyhydroxyalkanoic acid synthase PhaR subunit
VADQTSTSPDPLAAWREWVSQSERQWNAFLNEAMATEAYGQSVGRFMELYVAMQKSMADAMGRYVTALNLPARGDVLALGDRLGAIESRLAGIEQRLARLSGPAPRAEDPAVDPLRPPRTKRPPGL